jgi:hypothetical protein
MKRWMIALPVVVAGGAVFFLSSCGRESSQTEVKISYGAQYAISRVDPTTQNIKAELFLSADNKLQATMEHTFADNLWKFTYASSPDKPVTLTNEHFPEPTAESLADEVKDVWDNLRVDKDPSHANYWGYQCRGWCAVEFCLEWICDEWGLHCACEATGSACWDTACCGGGCGGGT